MANDDDTEKLTQCLENLIIHPSVGLYPGKRSGEEHVEEHEEDTIQQTEKNAEGTNNESEDSENENMARQSIENAKNAVLQSVDNEESREDDTEPEVKAKEDVAELEEGLTQLAITEEKEGPEEPKHTSPEKEARNEKKQAAENEEKKENEEGEEENEHDDFRERGKGKKAYMYTRRGPEQKNYPRESSRIPCNKGGLDWSGNGGCSAVVYAQPLRQSLGQKRTRDDNFEEPPSGFARASECTWSENEKSEMVGGVYSDALKNLDIDDFIHSYLPSEYDASNLSPPASSSYNPVLSPALVLSHSPAPSPGQTFVPSPNQQIPAPSPGQTFVPSPNQQIPAPSPGQTFVPSPNQYNPAPSPGQTFVPSPNQYNPAPSPGQTFVPSPNQYNPAPSPGQTFVPSPNQYNPAPSPGQTFVPSPNQYNPAPSPGQTFVPSPNQYNPAPSPGQNVVRRPSESSNASSPPKDWGSCVDHNPPSNDSTQSYHSQSSGYVSSTSPMQPVSSPEMHSESSSQAPDFFDDFEDIVKSQEHDTENEEIEAIKRKLIEGSKDLWNPVPDQNVLLQAPPQKTSLQGHFPQTPPKTQINQVVPQQPCQQPPLQRPQPQQLQQHPPQQHTTQQHLPQQTLLQQPVRQQPLLNPDLTSTILFSQLQRPVTSANPPQPQLEGSRLPVVVTEINSGTQPSQKLIPILPKPPTQVPSRQQGTSPQVRPPPPPQASHYSRSRSGSGSSTTMSSGQLSSPRMACQQVNNTWPQPPPPVNQMAKASLEIAKLGLQDLLYIDEEGDSKLHLYVVDNRVAALALIHRLVRENQLQALLDHRNRLMQTPLYLAVIVKATEVVAELLKHGADVNAEAIIPKSHVDVQNRCTPLHSAARSATLRILELLLNAPGIIVDAINYKGETPLLFAIRAHGERERGSSQQKREIVDSRGAIRMLLQHGASLGQKDLSSGRTPLHHLVEKNNYELLDFVLQETKQIQEGEFQASGCMQNQISDVINLATFDGNTALHLAAGLNVASENDHVKLVRLLLAHGADGTRKNCNNSTPKDNVFHKRQAVIDVLRGHNKSRPTPVLQC